MKGDIHREIYEGGIYGRGIWGGDIWLGNMYNGVIGRRGKYEGEAFGRDIQRLKFNQCES